MFLVGFIDGLYRGMGFGMGPYVQIWAGLTIQFGIVFWLHRDMRLRGYRYAHSSTLKATSGLSVMRASTPARMSSRIWSGSFTVHTAMVLPCS